MRARTLFAVMPAVVLTACVNPQVVGRYQSAQCIVEGVKKPQRCAEAAPDVEFHVASTAGKPPGQTKITALPERALTKFIEVTGTGKSAKEVAQSLALVIAPEDKDAADLSVLNRTFAINVAKTTFNPADRIAFAKITIKLLDGARFEEWGSVKTENAEYSMGTIKGTDQIKIGADVTLKPPEADILLNEAGLSFERQRSREEQLEYKQKVETLNAWIGGKGNAEAVILRQGVMGVDVAGLTTFEASVRPGSTVTWTFFAPKYDVAGAGEGTDNKKEKPAQQEKEKVTAKEKEGGTDNKNKPHTATLAELELNRTPQDVSLHDNDVIAEVSALYGIRHITSGDGTFEEKDDDVEFIVKQAAPSTQIVIPRKALAELGWTLRSYKKGEEWKELYVSQKGFDNTPLCFKSVKEAQAFKAYVAELPAGQPLKEIGKKNVVIGFSPQTFKEGEEIDLHKLDPATPNDVENLQPAPCARDRVRPS